MNLNKCLLTHNSCYAAGQTIVPGGIIIHSTGADNTSISRYVQPREDEAQYAENLSRLGVNRYANHWNFSNAEWQAKYGSKLNKCVHAFVGRLADGTLASYQTLPWNMLGWHAGGSANRTFTSMEICEDGLTDADYFAAAYGEATELAAYLCGLYGLDPMADGVILGHCEAAARGMASSHADPHNWFLRFGKSMDSFRADTAALMVAGSGETPSAQEQPDGGANIIYRVQVGAYRIRENADGMKSKLLADGYSAAITAADGVWRVQAGAFTAKENAEALRGRLTDDGYAAIVVRTAL